MNQLMQLVENLQETEATVTYLALALEASPDDEVLRINAEAVQKRQQDLARRVDQTLYETSSEIVRYRIKRDWTDAYPAKAVAASLIAFQDLVTAVFDAIRTTPKLRFRPAPESVDLSTFEFAGAYGGSVVVSLVIPEERVLIGETDLQETFGLVERALSARESEDLKLLAERIGVAAISKAYAWAAASADYGIDTEITWGRSLGETQDIIITRDDAKTVSDLIANRSDTTSVPFTYEGILLGFDGHRSYFHFDTFGEKLEITGNVASGVPTIWTTDRPYRALLMRTSQIKYSTGEELITWTLHGLESLPAPEPPTITAQSA